jgi:hypothetical protein
MSRSRSRPAPVRTPGCAQRCNASSTEPNSALTAPLPGRPSPAKRHSAAPPSAAPRGSSTNGTPYQAALRPCDVLGDEAITGFRAALRDATQKIITLNGRQDGPRHRDRQPLPRGPGPARARPPRPSCTTTRQGRTLTNHAEKITNRSQSPASRAEMRHPLRQRTVSNNGIVPQQDRREVRITDTQAPKHALDGQSRTPASTPTTERLQRVPRTGRTPTGSAAALVSPRRPPEHGAGRRAATRPFGKIQDISPNGRAVSLPPPVCRGQGWTGPLGPRSRRIDCMIANVVVLV